MKISEVVNRINGNVDRFTTSLIYYIGGEHFESNELEISKRGLIKPNLNILGFKFHFAFQERDVLFMARNPHLRKAGMVFFSGICSDASYILRSKDEKILTQEYLAVMLQSDHFWNYCESHKVGSVNFAINWTTMANYEFDLPPIKEQLTIANKVWAAYRLKQAYKKLLIATDEMVKSQFIEMYRKTHKELTLESVCTIMGKGITPKYVDSSSVVIINQACVHWNGQHLENVKYHNESIPVKKRTLETGDVLLNATGNGTLGRCCVFSCPSDENKYINDGHVIALSTDRSVILPEVLNSYLSLSDTQAEIYRQYVTGSTNQIDIVFTDIKRMTVLVPNMGEQLQFVSILQQADKSKFELKQCIENIDKVIKSLING